MTVQSTVSSTDSTHRPDNSPGSLTVAALRAMLERGRQRQPMLTGRLEKAAAIVVLRRIEPREGGWLVESDSQEDMSYYVNDEHGTCTCPDFQRAPLGFCKHRLAVGLIVQAEREGHSVNLTSQRERLSDERVAVSYGLAFAGGLSCLR